MKKKLNKSLSAIKRIEEAASHRRDVISLAQGIPSLKSHELIRKGVISSIKENKVDKYSPVSGIPELKNLIIEDLRTNDMDYSKDEVIVTTGSIEALSSIMLALLNKSDEVLVITPTYFGNYKRIIEMAGGSPVCVSLDEKSGWRLNNERLEEKITKKTRFILLCNPNNPTGTVFSEYDLKFIGETALKHDLLVVTDDVYRNLYFEQDAKVVSLCQYPKYRENVVRIVSLSKDFSLSGWRVGFLHGPQSLVDKVLTVHENLVNCTPVVSQYAALFALNNQQVILSENISEYNKRRSLMGWLLDEMRNHLNFIYPEGAYYFFPKIKNVDNSESFCVNLMKKAGLATVPGSDFGEGGEGHIRLCFGRPEKDIIEGMKRLSSYLERYN